VLQNDLRLLNGVYVDIEVRSLYGGDVQKWLVMRRSFRPPIRKPLSCIGYFGEENYHTMKANPKKKYSPTFNLS
jgi:hypothetical protein